jgi:hypothetical protein
MSLITRSIDLAERFRWPAAQLPGLGLILISACHGALESADHGVEPTVNNASDGGRSSRAQACSQAHGLGIASRQRMQRIGKHRHMAGPDKIATTHMEDAAP